MTFYSLGRIPKYPVPLRMLCTLGWGLWGTISQNNSNKTTLHLHCTLQLKCAFMYVIQIIEGTSCQGRRRFFKGRLSVSVL